jgi:hypothetical protein
MNAYAPPPPAWGRRKRLYWLGVVVGLGLTTLAWAGVLLGWLPPESTGRVMSLLVLAALFTPFAAMWNNPGEKRTRVQRFAEFTYCWVLVSGIAQTAFELPWFLLDWTGIVQGASPDNHWLWMWWVYGGADTRYLTSNPTIAGIEFCAGIAGPLELLAWYWFKRGQRIRANWVALLLGVGLTWGTLVFFVAEVHVGFVNVKQGAFGLWVKWFGLNLPWILAPCLFIPGSIWDLAALYEARGSARARADLGDGAGDLEPRPLAGREERFAAGHE